VCCATSIRIKLCTIRAITIAKTIYNLQD
jgi:hypothetical protein